MGRCPTVCGCFRQLEAKQRFLFQLARRRNARGRKCGGKNYHSLTHSLTYSLTQIIVDCSFTTLLCYLLHQIVSVYCILYCTVLRGWVSVVYCVKQGSERSVFFLLPVPVPSASVSEWVTMNGNKLGFLSRGERVPFVNPSNDGAGPGAFYDTQFKSRGENFAPFGCTSSEWLRQCVSLVLYPVVPDDVSHVWIQV